MKQSDNTLKFEKYLKFTNTVALSHSEQYAGARGERPPEVPPLDQSDVLAWERILEGEVDYSWDGANLKVRGRGDGSSQM